MLRILRAIPIVVPCLLAAQIPQDTGHFIANHGQWQTNVEFRTRSGTTTAWFTSTGWAMSHVEAIEVEPRRPAPDSMGLDAIGRFDGASVRMTFDGAQPTEPVGEERLPGMHHYLLGNDRRGWVRDARSFSRLRYRAVWPGIDVVVRPGSGVFAYDVYIADTANVGNVAILCDGVDSIEIADDGRLMMSTPLGQISQTEPIAWHVLPSGDRQRTTCRFRSLGENRFGFEVDERLPGCTLIIDPDLTWMTHMGGSDNDPLSGIATDGNGIVTVAGRSLSVNYPTSVGAFQPTGAGLFDATVTRFDPSMSGASQIVWSTLLGDAADDVAYDVVLGPGGGATVAGLTTSPQFPTTAGAYQSSIQGGIDGFITTLAPGGGTLLASTFLGGPRDDFINGLDVDPSTFDVTVMGYTMSVSFPTTPSAYQPTFAGGLSDAFVARLDLTGSTLLASTFLGGTANEFQSFFAWFNNLNDMNRGDVVVAGTLAIVSGVTTSSDFPTTPGAFQTTNASTSGDVWVSVLDLAAAGAAQQVYGTYIGGTNYEVGKAVGYEPRSGIIAVGGYCYSSNYPTTAATAVRPAFTGATNPLRNDAYVSFLDPSQSGTAQLLYSTYLGTPWFESVFGLEMDARGVATAVGFTRASGFPVTAGAFDTSYNGGTGTNADAFLARIDPQRVGAASLVYSTYVGSGSSNWFNSLALDGSGGAYVVGRTHNPASPLITAGAAQPNFGGGSNDGVVGHLNVLPRLVGSTTALDRDRAGVSEHCDGSIIFEVSTQPVSGTSFDFWVGNAPPNAVGVLAFGSPAPCAPTLGANVCLVPFATILLTSDALGTATLPFAYGGQTGFRTQTAWFGTVTCPGAQPLSSSATLDFF